MTSTEAAKRSLNFSSLHICRSEHVYGCRTAASWL